MMFGSMETLINFSFEKKLQKMKNLLRKSGKPLQQIVWRLQEIDRAKSNQKRISGILHFIAEISYLWLHIVFKTFLDNLTESAKNFRNVDVLLKVTIPFIAHRSSYQLVSHYITIKSICSSRLFDVRFEVCGHSTTNK
jgi:hypothetical protein